MNYQKGKRNAWRATGEERYSTIADFECADVYENKDQMEKVETLEREYGRTREAIELLTPLVEEGK
jgi:hypothetical protein